MTLGKKLAIAGVSIVVVVLGYSLLFPKKANAKNTKKKPVEGGDSAATTPVKESPYKTGGITPMTPNGDGTYSDAKGYKYNAKGDVISSPSGATTTSTTGGYTSTGGVTDMTDNGDGTFTDSSGIKYDSDGNVITEAADGTTPNPAEGSAVAYVAQRGHTKHKKFVADSGIEVRTTDPTLLAPAGMSIVFTHPNYNSGQPQTVVVSGNWDSGDGTGSVYLPINYNSGTTSQTSDTGQPQDLTPNGTLTLASAMAGSNSADGGEWDIIGEDAAANGWHNASGSKPYFSKIQATSRRAAQTLGVKKGLKGKALTRYINAQAPVILSQAKNALKRQAAAKIKLLKNK